MQILKWTAEELFKHFVVIEKKFVLVTFNDMNIYWKVVKSQVGITLSKTIFSLLLRSSGVCVFVDCSASGSDSSGTHDGRITPARALLSGDHKCSIALKAEHLATYVNNVHS